MPTNAVYQPTTVSFENSGAIFPQTSTTSRLKTAFRKPWMKILLLVGSLFFIALGCVLCAASFADYEDAINNEDIVTELPVHEKELDKVLMALGAFFFLFGIFLLGKLYCDESSSCLLIHFAICYNSFLYCRIIYQNHRMLA